MKDHIKWGQFGNPLLKAQKEHLSWFQNNLESTLTCLLKKKIDIWDNVKMLLEGSELTKEDQESQLFVTAVKLNRGLRESNYDQLYAYLKQHETHVKENKMMLECFSQHTVDPLALMSNVSNPQHYSPSSSTSSSTQVPQHPADNPHLDSSISPMENLIKNLTNTMALLTQSYKTFLPQTNNQLQTSSNARNQATGGGAGGYGGVQNRVGNVNPGQARPVKCYNCNGARHIARNCTQPKRPQNSEYYKDNMLLMLAQENEVALDAEQLLFLADPVTDEAGPSYDSDNLSE
nr:hypothetical protein [Tanacetum cinerariifolium]